MDIVRKTQEIIKNKINIQTKENETIKYFIVYLICNDDIVFIGKTSNILEYIEERKEKYSITHYSFEEIEKDKIDNYMAEVILELQPIYNNRVPNNTKYISHNVAKKDYFIYKTEFRKVFEEYGGYKFKSSLYIEKKIFDDIFTQIPYHEYMPKIGKKILLLDDYKLAELNLGGGTVRDILYDESGNPVEAYRDYIPNYEEEYRKLKFLEEKEYKVVALIDSHTFQAVNYNNEKKILVKAENKRASHIFFTNQDKNSLEYIWIDSIDEYTARSIRYNYLESLDK